MRKWYKYKIQKRNNLNYLSLDNSKEEHTRALTKDILKNAYESKKSFYKYYYYNYQQGRLKNYENFLIKHLNIMHNILSVASGRSANELRFIDKGYKILCTDLYKFNWYAKTKKLYS